ncbi:44946_t:CDS:2, partial [Gigaspora margarita]
DTILFETMRKLLRKTLTDNLKLLPDSPDLIPEHIKEFLPFVLPIAKRKNTRAVSKTENILPLRPDPTTVLCLASRETKRFTSSHSAKIVTKSTTTIPIGPNASSPRLLRYSGNATEEIQLQIQEGANKHIPTTKSVPRLFHAFSFKATKLQQALKLSNKARKIISLSPFPKSSQIIANKINIILQQIGELADYPISSITEQDL